MTASDPLAEYWSRRNFRRTPEPRGRVMPEKGFPVFAVHRQRAHALVRYHLRLEAEGVLKSWALAVGLPTEPDDSRVALRVEDHPLEYQSFEGVIPEGEHNAGVMVMWDAGPYVNLSVSGGRLLPVGEAIAAGQVIVGLAGQRLHGRYVLSRHSAEDRAWLVTRVPEGRAGGWTEPVIPPPSSERPAAADGVRFRVLRAAVSGGPASDG
jgi:DNA ligase D-like protein (predicted 3'-phosphoesterase)